MALGTQAQEQIGLRSPPEMGGITPMFDPAKYREREQKSADIEKQIGETIKAREAALTPVETKMADLQKTAPELPKFEKLPDKLEYKGPNPKEQQEFLSSMFMFAALGGMMTRQPMTAALNSFASAMAGYRAGDAEKFQRESKVFEENLKLAISKNKQAHDEYMMAFEKHKGNVSALKTEWDLIARKYGDTISQLNTENNNVKGQLQRMEAMRRGDQSAMQSERQHKLQMAKMQESLNMQRANLEERRREFDLRQEQSQRQFEARLEQQRVLAEQKIAAAKEKGSAAGLKGKQLDTFIHNTSNIEAMDELIKAIAENPDAVGFKTLVPGIILNRADPEGIPIRASIANVTSLTIKDRAGLAQTVSEMKNLAPFIPRQGDDANTVITKLRGMQKEMRRMNDTMLTVTGATQRSVGGRPMGGGAQGAAPPLPPGFTEMK